MLEAINQLAGLFRYENYNLTVDQSRRINLFTASVVNGFFFALSFIPLYAYMGFTQALYVVPAMAIGFLASGILYKVTGKLLLAGNFFAAVCYGGMLGIALVGDGLFTPTIPYLISAVVSAFWYANQKWGFIWVGICAVTILLLAFFQGLNTVNLSADYPPAFDYLYHGIALSGLVFYVLIVVYVYEHHRNVAMNQLEHAHNEIRNQHEELQQQTEEIQQQRDQLEKRGQQLELAYTQITDSVKYAKRIQGAILGEITELDQWFSDSFVLFRPKDIVSGDFYWMKEVDGKKIIVAADCTGHGVPGAFMTIYGTMVFDEVIKNRKITDPGKILAAANDYVVNELQTKNSISDGMDAAILVIDQVNKQIHFGGAKNPLYRIDRSGELQQYKGSKAPIGAIQQKIVADYKTESFTMVPGEKYYIFSDGYQDQFGGEDARKFMTKNFRNFLHQISKKDMASQKVDLEEKHLEWKGAGKQTDDILVIGVSL
jgi:serine phosphatase RsbU (regulator of sigma subunit)